MNKSKIPAIFLALFGLIVAIAILYGSIRFFHTVKELTQNNPPIMPARDTLRVSTNNDTLVDYNASLNQQIAEKLNDKKEPEMNRKQMLLHTAISYFIFYMDTLQKGNYTHEEKLRMIKNSVNKTNLSCRAALFDVHDAEQIRELNDFIIVDEKKPENRIFECLQEKEIPVQCFDKIKHQALYIEKIILEKNFKKLNL